MNVNNNISGALTTTLCNSDLQDITADFSEIAIDALISNEILKEVPVVKTILGVGRGIVNVRDKLFLQKIMAFLNKAKDVSMEERRCMIEEIDSSKEHRLKVGEKLLYLLERSDDWQMAEILAIIFNEFIKGGIEYGEFVKIAKILESLTIYDVRHFFEITRGKAYSFTIDRDFRRNEVGDLMNTALFTFYMEEINVEDQDDWKMAMHGKYKTEGGEIIIEVTKIGFKFREILEKHYFT